MRRLSIALGLAFCLASIGAAKAEDDLTDLAFRPHPGNELPLAVPLRDERGESVSLGQFFTGKPVLLVLQYLRCKTLCGLTLSNVVTALDALPFTAGRDFQMVALSIDPRDTPADAASAKAKYAALYHHTADNGFHFLTGSRDSVQQVADAVGFPYRYDPELDQYSHPAGFVVAAPDGRISRYVLGVGFAPADLQRAIEEAAQGRTTGPLTRILLLCHIAVQPGKYTVPVLAAFTLANLAGMAALIAVFAAIRRRRHG
jgi:protein SCO1/2